MKKKYTALLLAILTTVIEYYWFLPDGISCSEPTDDSTIFPLLLLIFLVTIVVLFIGRFFSKRMEIKVIIGLIFVWFFSNYQSFNDRISCWSTYLFSEEISEVLSLSLIPISTCIIIFIIGNIFLGKIKVNNDKV